MNSDQLRALADALSSGTHYVESPELHETMMRAAALLIVLLVAGLVACGSASDDPAQRVEKPAQVAPSKE